MKISTAQTDGNHSLSTRSEVTFSGVLPEYAPSIHGTEEDLWRQAVELWMRWHTAQESLTAAMFASRHEPARQAELMEEMDQMDQLRWRAVEISQELLSTTGA